MHHLIRCSALCNRATHTKASALSLQSPDETQVLACHFMYWTLTGSAGLNSMTQAKYLKHRSASAEHAAVIRGSMHQCMVLCICAHECQVPKTTSLFGHKTLDSSPTFTFRCLTYFIVHSTPEEYRLLNNTSWLSKHSTGFLHQAQQTLQLDVCNHAATRSLHLLDTSNPYSVVAYSN